MQFRCISFSADGSQIFKFNYGHPVYIYVVKFLTHLDHKSNMSAKNKQSAAKHICNSYNLHPSNIILIILITYDIADQINKLPI